jgi:hypothetical protein
VNPLPDGNGATTEVGSDPGADPEAAVGRAFLEHARMPFVPELPRRDPREGMVDRLLGGLEFVRGSPPALSLPLDDPALLRLLDESEWPPPSEARASGLTEVLRRPPPVAAPPVLLKVAVVGPVTLARHLRDPAGRPVASAAEVADALGRRVASLAARIARSLALGGWSPVVQLDEPGACDALLVAERTRLEDVLAAVRDAAGRTAVHDCGAVDGGALLALAPDAISVDATREPPPLLGDGESLARYLRAGGSVIWGVVPTDGRPLPARTAARALLEAAGAATGDRALVRRRGWLSPACGLGTLTAERAEAVRSALRAAAAGWT